MKNFFSYSSSLGHYDVNQSKRSNKRDYQDLENPTCVTRFRDLALLIPPEKRKLQEDAVILLKCV